ncbi:MAG: hypothetical protein KGN76_04315 [Acidobacteriota bacterium]|nr:hypothetical protein [Acidobacteriota bacterium]
MKSTNGILYFHAPCFDGLASAVLMWDFLETRRGWTAVSLRGVNYGIRPRWLAIRPARPFAVVDFLYHPRAAVWADHHQTTFLDERMRQSYERRRSDDRVYDPDAPSCASLIWRHLHRAFDYRNDRFAALVEWATRIDAARYRSVDEVFEAKSPALAINLALSQIEDLKDCGRLVRHLKTHDLEETSALPVVRTHADRARRLFLEGMKRFRRGAKLVDDIVVFDVDAGKAMVSRYAPYRVFPDARYSAGIVRTGDTVKITAMRNPWREFKSVPLGKIFRQVGGGGHQRVASVVLKASDVPRATQVLDNVVTSIRHHERG